MSQKSEKLKQTWRKVWPSIKWVILASSVLGAIFALIYIPKMQVPVCPPGKEGLPPKICFDIENEARKTLAYIMGGILAIIGITLAYRRIRALEHQVSVAQEGQITERFTRAIEQLGSDRMEVRLGGIYALERIANDSDKDYWAIMETLTAYVRERAPLCEKHSESPWPSHEKKPSTDIQAILTVLGRRKYRMNEGNNLALDLRNTDLRGAVLHGHWECAFFMNAQIESASFIGSRLKGVFFWDAHLEGANFHEACLEAADFRGAYLEGAIFWDAHLESADFSESTGLTSKQLARAILDENTILPNYLQKQPQEGKGSKRDSEK